MTIHHCWSGANLDPKDVPNTEPRHDVSHSCSDEGAVKTWLRFYECPENIQGFVSLSEKLGQWHQTFIGRMTERLMPRLRRDSPIRIWSAGSGIDNISLRLKAIYGDSVEMTIFDVSPECISANRQAFERNGLQAEFVVGDLFKADYTDEFDIVFNTGLLEHFGGEQQEVLLRVFSDSLRPGGEYLTYVPYAGGRMYAQCMKRMKDRGVWKYGPEVPISTFRGLSSGNLVLAEESQSDALTQLAFVSPAYPVLGRVLTPVTALAFRFPSVFEPVMMSIFGGYGLYARYEKPA